MKLVLKLIGGLAVLLLLLVLIAFFLPRRYRVERSTVIHAPSDAVFAQFGDLRAWKNWGAWQERDPGMKLTYSEKTVGIGAWSAWESKSEGNGKMTITAFEPGKSTAYVLEFPEMNMASQGSMTLQPADGGVKVVWADAGDLGLNPMHRWFGLFLDKMIGPDFERGLAKMKALAEAGSK